MHYALPGKEKYPLETEEQVKLANDYFGKYLEKFHPVERATIAANIEKRAEQLNMDCGSGWIKNYSRRNNYSPEFDVHMKMRKEACAGLKIKIGDKNIDAQEILEKIASQKSDLSPAKMMYLIADFDKRACVENLYDKRFRDPIFTVFGSSSMPNFDLEKVGACQCPADDLKKAVKSKNVMSKIASTFGEGFTNDFKSNPVGIFESMPKPEQELISGLVKIANNEDGKNE